MELELALFSAFHFYFRTGCIACLFVEMLCYVLGRRLHSSCVLSTRIGLHRIEVINETLVNDDFYLFIHV